MNRVEKTATGFVAVLSVACLLGLHAWAGTLHNSGRRGLEHDKHTAMRLFSVPTQKNNVQVNKGETVLFATWITDVDRARIPADPPTPAGPWRNKTNKGPYQVQWAITGAAEFDSAGSGKTTKTTTGYRGNAPVVIKATWNEAGTITVKATVKDMAPNPSPAPNTGTIKDPNVVITWTLVKRVNPCPTSMAMVNAANKQGKFLPRPARYQYKMKPDIGGDGKADYTGQAVLETFAPAKAGGGFTMADLTNAWKTANPTATTPDKAAAAIFSSGGLHGTFVIDGADQIGDQHSGWGEIDPFKRASRWAGISYVLTQTFSCAGNDIGKYTITVKLNTSKRRPNDLTFKVNKVP